MLGLKLETDPRWVNIVEKNISEILTDHAYCEQKAATNALSIMISYPYHTDLVVEMVKLAKEELTHFELVHQKINERGLTLGFERKDELEIGPLFKGQGKEAKQSYIQGLSDVLNNAKKYLVEDYDIFLVANDKYNMYPTIAGNAGMQIVNQYKRPVLNRTEKDTGAYAEIIFHLKSK